MNTRIARLVLALLPLGVMPACTTSSTYSTTSSYPSPVAEGPSRVVEGWSRETPEVEMAIIREESPVRYNRVMQIEPFYTGSTYRARTLYGRP